MKELEKEKNKWFQEGLLLQLSQNQFVLGTAPFSFHKKPLKGFYFPGFFFQNPLPWIKPKRVFFLDRKDLISWLLSQEAIKNPPDPNPFSLPSFTEFNSVFSQLKQQIKRGELQKGVPVFFEQIKVPARQVSFFLNNFYKNKGFLKRESFLYGFWGQSSGFLGFTPEILFSNTSKRLQIMALAGTASHPGPPLMSDPKEVKEHDFVVKSLRESLKEIFIEEKYLIREKTFGSLKHLCSLMEGRLRGNFDFEGLCRRLHPSPALGGYPKKKALTWLQQEPHQKQRKVFASPFGFFDGKNEGFCILAIRCIQWNTLGAFIGSGAGIIEESILQKEWRELFLKREAVKKLFLKS